MLDVGLPKIGGWDVYREIKRENPDARVIVASGYLDPELRALHESKIQRVIQKPYIPGDIMKTIDKLIGER